MKIIFSHKISRKEKIEGVHNEIIKAFSKGIFTRIKGFLLPKNSNLIKIYMTSVAGARRAVFMIDTQSKDCFFLFYRSKNDKIGQNISIKNPKFKSALTKYLNILYNDLRTKSYDILEIKNIQNL